MNILFSGGAEESLRRKMLASGQVEAVVSFPGGVFRKSGVSVCILVLDPTGGHKSVRFVDASDYTSSKKGSVSSIDTKSILNEVSKKPDNSASGKTVKVEAILDSDADLSVGRYVLSDEQIAYEKRLESSELIRLGDVCQSVASLPAVAIKKEEPEEGAGEYTVVKLLDMSCFTEHGYIKEPEKEVFAEERVAKRSEFYLRANESVISTKGTVGKVGLLPPQAPGHSEGGWLPSPSTAVLRFTETSPMDSRVLFMQLRSDLGQHFISRMIVGATIPMIRLKDLMDMNVLAISPGSKESKSIIKAFELEVELQHQIEELKNTQRAVSKQLDVFQM